MNLAITTVNNYYSSTTALATVATTQQTPANAEGSTPPIAAVTAANSQSAAASSTAQNTNGQSSEGSKAVTYDSSDGTTSNTADGNKQPDKKKAKVIVDQLNDFMGTINTDIKFKLHDKTKEFMVDVVDSKTGRLIRECPSHEFLDMVARLKEYLGALVDKKI